MIAIRRFVGSWITRTTTHSDTPLGQAIAVNLGIAGARVYRAGSTMRDVRA
jgi:hypothetical protein